MTAKCSVRTALPVSGPGTATVGGNPWARVAPKLEEWAVDSHTVEALAVILVAGLVRTRTAATMAATDRVVTSETWASKRRMDGSIVSRGGLVLDVVDWSV